MTRIVNNCVALVCLCLFWGQSLRAADASHSEQIKWGNESVFNEEHNTLGLFSGVLGGQIVLAGGTSDDYSRWGRNAVCLSENAGFALYEDVLSKPLAYGASITLSDGILCIGGRDSSVTHKLKINRFLSICASCITKSRLIFLWKNYTHIANKIPTKLSTYRNGIF